MTDNREAVERAMKLAALSGLKIALGPAFLATSKRSPTARNWVMAAMGEMLLDKVGIFPARFRPMLLIPHTLAGAWVARESLREDGVEDPSAVAMGAVVAAGVACVAPMVRIAANRILGIPDFVLGIGEDYLALKVGTEATGVTMDRVADAARESVDEIKDRVAPAFDELRDRVRPALSRVGVEV